MSIVVSKDIVSRHIDLFDDDNDADYNGNKDDDDEEEEGFYFIRYINKIPNDCDSPNI